MSGKPDVILFRSLRAGMTLKDAAEAAGIPVRTVRWWRRNDPEYDAKVIAAAAEGGTVLRPAVSVACPGDRCGTPTGYDYGCRKQACTSAKSARVTAARQRKESSRD